MWGPKHTFKILWGPWPLWPPPGSDAYGQIYCVIILPLLLSCILILQMLMSVFIIMETVPTSVSTQLVVIIVSVLLDILFNLTSMTVKVNIHTYVTITLQWTVMSYNIIATSLYHYLSATSDTMFAVLKTLLPICMKCTSQG